MHGNVLQYNTYLLEVPVTHPDECRTEQEASGIHTKNSWAGDQDLPVFPSYFLASNGR